MKKIIALLLACLMVAGLFAGCQPAQPGNTNPSGESTEATPAAPQDITLTVWAPAEDQGDETKWLNQMLKKFEEAHPEYNITWKLGVCSEGDAYTNVSKDVAAAADVFMYANDQLGTLMQAEALAKIGGDYLAQVQNLNSDTLLSTVTYTDGGVYGFPYTNNTWFMYYNKAIFSEDDIKSLDAMMAKHKVAFPVTNSWYLASFYVAGGATLFGDKGIDGAAGIQLGDKATDVTKYLVNMVSNPNFMNDIDDGAAFAGLKDGSVGALFSGSWNAQKAKEALGENLGVAALPCITLNGQQAQLRSFAGSKAVGVNKQSSNPKAAMQLAAFLSTDEAQLAHYEIRGVIPSNKNLSSNDKIKADLVAYAEGLTMNTTAIGQPTIPEMGNYWGAADTMGKSLYNKEVTEANAAEHTQIFQDALNKSGL